MSVATLEGNEIMTDNISISDIPDLSNFEVEAGRASEPWQDGWYQGVINQERSFTDKNGNDRTFASGDSVSANGASRNVILQVTITRKDGKTFNGSARVNYRPEDLTQENVQAVTEYAKSGERGGPLFRSMMVLTRLSKLQKIAGVRQFQKSPEGGLDLTSVYGKTAYFKLGPDEQNPQYKAIVDFRESAPTRVPVL